MTPPDPASPGPRLTPEGALALLEWQIAMGADEALGEIAPNRLAKRSGQAAHLIRRRDVSGEQNKRPRLRLPQERALGRA